MAAVAGAAAAKGHVRISSDGHVLGALAGQHFAVTVSATAIGARAASARPDSQWPAASPALPLPALARIR